MYNIERALLATVLRSDMMQQEEQSRIDSAELYEEWFSHHPYKIIVKTINSLKMKAMPHFMEIVVDELHKHGHNLDEVVIDICTSTPMTYGTFAKYYDVLKNSKKKSLQELI